MRVGERKNSLTCPGVKPPFLVGVEIIDKIIECFKKISDPNIR